MKTFRDYLETVNKKSKPSQLDQALTSGATPIEKKLYNRIPSDITKDGSIIKKVIKDNPGLSIDKLYAIYVTELGK